MKIKELAAFVKAPISSTDPNVGVTQIDVTASSQRFDIPSGWRGRYVRLTCVGEDVDLLLGGSGVTVVFEEASGVSSEVITTDVNTGDRFVAGQSDHFYVPDAAGVTHFAVIASSTSGKIYIRPT